MMIRSLIAASALAVGTLGAAGTASATNVDVGVSIQISQPGVYGRIDIGRFPQPAVIYPQPVIIAPPHAVVVRPQPVYMWVPPGHRKNWRKHCAAYGACGVPVAFVRDDWYSSHVQPYARGGRYYDDHDHDRGYDDHGHGKGKGKDKDRGRGH